MTLMKAGARGAVEKRVKDGTNAVNEEMETVPMNGMAHREVRGVRGWRVSGPEDHVGALPAVIYFALSAEQSLGLAPYNHLTQFVLNESVSTEESRDASNAPLRVYSVTLPYHGTMTQNEAAFGNWARAYSSGQDVLESFLKRTNRVIDSLVEDGLIDSDNVWTAGLSRGGLIASHIGIRNKYVKGVVGFASVTVPGDLRELKTVSSEALDALSLKNEEHICALSKKQTRYYMGNRDELVSTRNCFDVVHALAETNAKGFRSPPHEMIMYCSIGKAGHGTPEDIFSDGARWLRKQMRLPSER
eukprot:CAMPEP_0185846336 /NCGR_PEP_ID=MMETSP1354-20130828/2015_1 /TAXON_ID=708628 /ORGANISM="Erythrolobus madagascarensis, Strain CCMP3276" /LENGTH=301 /DNA_ID=CAMNT_0028546461 /DNA_START=77 /DNA_END=982 /DNA_ORIENTATION=-